jgi:hypothetical protein
MADGPRDRRIRSSHRNLHAADGVNRRTKPTGPRCPQVRLTPVEVSGRGRWVNPHPRMGRGSAVSPCVHRASRRETYRDVSRFGDVPGGSPWCSMVPPEPPRPSVPVISYPCVILRTQGSGVRVPPGVPLNSSSERRRGGVHADGQRRVGMTEVNRGTLTTGAVPGPSARSGPSSVGLPGALWSPLSSRERNYPFFLGFRFKCMIGDLGVVSDGG